MQVDSAAAGAIREEAIKQAATKEKSTTTESDPRRCRIDGGAATRWAVSRSGTGRNGCTEYRPGDAVRATIKVTDHAGQPQAAELSLATVDESVYTFGEDNLDALPAFFHRPYETRRFLPKVWRTSVGRHAVDSERRAIRELQQRAMDQMAKASLESKQGESLPDLRDQHLTAMPLPRLGAEMPSAQIPLSRLREHFHETATWLPQLRTDERGVAQATFTLPDSFTRYRLTSVALSKTTEVGIGRAKVHATLPLAVQLFLPRFAVEQDHMQLAVKAWRAAVRVEVPVGEPLRLLGHGERWIELEREAARSVVRALDTARDNARSLSAALVGRASARPEHVKAPRGILIAEVAVLEIQQLAVVGELSTLRAVERERTASFVENGDEVEERDLQFARVAQPGPVDRVPSEVVDQSAVG